MLYLSLLGEQAISDGGASLRAHSSRTAALVAFLVAHAGSPQPRQRIAGLFWPESTDAQALTNLRRELHHLRQVLGDEPSLVVTPRDLCWRDTDTCRVDLRIFDIEREAAARPPRPATTRRSSPTPPRPWPSTGATCCPAQYDDWLLEARSELDRQCVDLCDLLAGARARAGDLAGAVAAARRRIQLQPLEEAGYRTLMRLQADLGDRAGAVSTYHHCASVLERELGVAARPGDPAGVPAAAGPTASRPRRPGAPEPPGRCGSLRAGRWPSSSAGPVSCGGSRRVAGRRRGRPGLAWSAAARASARPGWSPSSPRWPGCRAPWWPAASASARRAAGAGAGRRLAAQPGHPGRRGGPGPGLAGRR